MSFISTPTVLPSLKQKFDYQMKSDEKILETLKLSRKSIEHIDNVLSVFRNIVFTIDAALVPIVFEILKRFPEGHLRYLFFIGLFLNIVGILLWLSEKHYHAYLVASSKVAKRAEKHLGLDDNLCLTECLARTKKLTNFYIPIGPKKLAIHFYDLIYFWISL